MVEMLENPMISGFEYREPTPDLVCKRCGSEWYKCEDGCFEGDHSASRRPMSQTGRYCRDCILQADTSDALERWALEEVDAREIMLWAIGGRGYASETEASKLFLEAMKSFAPDVYFDTLRGYPCKACDHHQACHLHQSGEGECLAALLMDILQELQKIRKGLGHAEHQGNQASNPHP